MPTYGTNTSLVLVLPPEGVANLMEPEKLCELITGQGKQIWLQKLSASKIFETETLKQAPITSALETYATSMETNSVAELAANPTGRQRPTNDMRLKPTIQDPIHVQSG